MATAAILELPGKGAYAPNKFGCRFGSFLKTDVPGIQKPIWIYEGKIYPINSQEAIDEFNAICAKVIPHCYQLKMKVTTRIVVVPGKAKKAKPKAPPKAASKTPAAPQLPAFHGPNC